MLKLIINHKEHIMQNNINSVAANAKLEERYQVRKAFENGEPLQYRKLNPTSFEEWRDATWSRWEWAKYEYRIKPKEKVELFVPVYPYLVNGIVTWYTEERIAHKQQMYPDVKFTRITKFRTSKGVRNAVIEEEA